MAKWWTYNKLETCKPWNDSIPAYGNVTQYLSIKNIKMMPYK